MCMNLFGLRAEVLIRDAHGKLDEVAAAVDVEVGREQRAPPPVDPVRHHALHVLSSYENKF